MIISASRRTDIPTFFSDWFYNRIREGYLYVRNPMNAHQISKINLAREVVDCIVFWTKNPVPMLRRMDEIKDYMYYFQFTLTGYGRDIERNLPDKKEVLIPTFREMAEKIGKKRMIWRYDPIVFTEKYTMQYHLHAFEEIAKSLKGYTEKCVISFVDVYRKNKRNLENMNYHEETDDVLTEFASKLNYIARENDMVVATCAEKINLEKAGIEHNCCIDKTLIEELIGGSLNVDKDKNQREECGCMASIEVGTYNTCPNGCRYCYANDEPETIKKNYALYDPNSPLLCGKLNKEDVITERKVASLADYQFSMF